MLAHARRAVGTLILEVSPTGAHVSVDGEPIDGGATRELRVNAGTHVVRANAEHHRGALVEVEVEPGETVRRALSLTDTRSPARLTVVAPGLDGARIELDGEAVGEGRAALDLDAGEHRLRVTHPRIGAHDRTLRLEWGERASVFVDAPAPAADLASEPGLWVGVAAAALAVGGAVALGFVLGQETRADGGSSGVVLTPSRIAITSITF